MCVGVAKYLADKSKFIGKKYGHWEVIDTYDGSRVMAKCDCGSKPRPMLLTLLRHGRSKRCVECKHENPKTHGMSDTPLYRVWRSMRVRCSDPKSKAYEYYGGRGIRVCDEWDSAFEPFMEWSLSSGYEQGLEIDRIDNDGNYCAENCRWVTRTVNANNKTTNILISVGGEEKTIREVVGDSDAMCRLVADRLRNGWCVEDALLPLNGRGDGRFKPMVINVNGVEKTIKELSEQTGLCESAIGRRYAKRKNPLDIFAPIKPNRYDADTRKIKNKRIEEVRRQYYGDDPKQIIA